MPAGQPLSPLIQVRGGPWGDTEVSLNDLLDYHFKATPGGFLERAIAGWKAIALPHFSVRSLTGTSATTGGAIDAWAPNEGLPVIVTRATLYVVTKSTGAATVNIGVAANGTTSANNLLTTADVGTNSAVAFDNLGSPGSSGKAIQLMTGSQMLTVSSAADTTGFVGLLYYEFIKATSTGM